MIFSFFILSFFFSFLRCDMQKSDGAVYVLRELARRADGDAELLSRFDDEWLPTLAKLAALTHFRHASVLAETIWKQLPAIAAALGANRITAHLSRFAPAYAAACQSTRLVHSTASYALQDVRQLIGGGDAALIDALGELQDAEREAVVSGLKMR